MAIIVKTYCDMCEKEITPITGDQYEIRIKLNWFSPYGRSTRDGYDHIHKFELCKECSAKFGNDIEQFLTTYFKKEKQL